MDYLDKLPKTRQFNLGDKPVRYRVIDLKKSVKDMDVDGSRINNISTGEIVKTPKKPPLSFSENH